MTYAAGLMIAMLLLIVIWFASEALSRATRRDYRRFVQQDQVAERKRAVTHRAFKSRAGIKS